MPQRLMRNLANVIERDVIAFIKQSAHPFRLARGPARHGATRP